VSTGLFGTPSGDVVEAVAVQAWMVVIELKHYLTNSNPNKLLTIKKKGQVIHICKKIKHFCRNDYCIEFTDYADIQELYEEARYIQNSFQLVMHLDNVGEPKFATRQEHVKTMHNPPL
jgi:hypothetical protein